MNSPTEQFWYDWELATGALTGRRKLNQRDRKRWEREVEEWKSAVNAVQDSSMKSWIYAGMMSRTSALAVELKCRR